MRRFLAFTAIILLACLTVAACGSSKPAASSSSANSSAANSAVTATGAFGKAPKVTIPKAKAGGNLTVRTLIQGTGPVVTKNDARAANFVIYFWDGTTSALKGSTFGSTPSLIPSKTPLSGLDTALVGKKVGSRILAVIPPALGYGTSGDPQIGVTGTTTLVLVVDLLNAYSNTGGVAGTQVSDGGGTLPTVSAASGAAPTIKIPSSQPPTTLVAKTLIKGTGPAVTSGQYVIVQYTGVNWRTGKVFDSSWSRSQPLGFVVDAPNQVIQGWNLGLKGQTVGSRVMLVIPPKDGYGSSGMAQANIKGTDTLVFVVDILGAYGPK